MASSVEMELGLADLERGLGNLAQNAQLSETTRRRVIALQSSIRARAISRNKQLLSNSDLDRLELVLARLQSVVDVRKRDLKLQLDQYDQRGRSLTELVGAIDQERKKRERPSTAKAATPSTPATPRKASASTRRRPKKPSTPA